MELTRVLFFVVRLREIEEHRSLFKYRQNSSSREKIYILYSKIAYWCAIWNGHKTFTMCAIVYRSMRQIPNIPNIEVKKWVQTQISNPYIFVTIDYIIWSDDLSEIIVWYIWGISHRVAEIYKD